MKILKERSLVDTIPPAPFAELSTQVHAQENRVKAAFLNVHMNGANVPHVFCCGFKEES